ncbi:MAG: VIT1/CCC1 transporter family protein [Candidatus Omnitrophota bacterium]
MTPELRKDVCDAQRAEITEHMIYRRLSRMEKDPKNCEILRLIAEDELRHYQFYSKFTERDIAPDRVKAWGYILLARLFGLSFILRLMEQGENLAQNKYDRLRVLDPGIDNIIRDEEEHEHQLLARIDDESMRYAGSIVLGLNDALVELTGALAGFTLALPNTRLIATSGLIVGIAASLSMAASEYLSTKEESRDRRPIKACVYTGIAYIGVVVLLILPYFFIPNAFVCLGVALVTAVVVIAGFNYYISVVRGTGFRRQFLEMLAISLGVAVLNLFVGMAARHWLNVEV